MLIQPTAIQSRYAQLGGPRSLLGSPVTGEQATPDGSGAHTHYQRGSIYWSPATGAQLVRGAIRETWASSGSERSDIGYPNSDEYAIPGGGRSDFQKGSITWTPTDGAVVTRSAGVDAAPAPAPVQVVPGPDIGRRSAPGPVGTAADDALEPVERSLPLPALLVAALLLVALFTLILAAARRSLVAVDEAAVD